MNMMGRKYTMKRNYLMHLIQLVVILTSIWISLQATQAATTWNVPSNYATIAAAIASVSVVDGDTIEVAAGTYAENITINKSLVLQGVGATTTTIKWDSYNRHWSNHCNNNRSQRDSHRL